MDPPAPEAAGEPQASAVYGTAPAPAFEPAPAIESAASAGTDPVVPAAEVSEPSEAPNTDRVDDLLRQFRERYGRGGM